MARKRLSQFSIHSLNWESNPHPFNTLIYEAANGVSPAEREKIHSFCFGCIIKFETEYRDAVKELVEKGIIKKTGDQEWIDYLKKCNSYVPELEYKTAFFQSWTSARFFIQVFSPNLMAIHHKQPACLKFL